MKKNVERYYDKLSEVYDKATAGPGAWTAPASALDLLKDLSFKNSAILDLGAGTGQTVEQFVGEAKEITAVDISEQMLAQLNVKFPTVLTVHADAYQGLLNIEKKFRLVIAIGVLEFIGDLKDLIKLIREKIEPEGYFCFSLEDYVAGHILQGSKQSPCGIIVRGPDDISNFPVYRFSREEAEAMLDDAGFEIVRSSRSCAYLKTSDKHEIYYNYFLAAPKRC